MKKQLNNTVIKNLTPEMGDKIIKKYQDDGWDTKNKVGAVCELNKNIWIYYGVIDNKFNRYTLEQVQKSNARIIELDYEPEFSPKRGDEVLVWNSIETGEYKAIYIATIKGALYPILAVHFIHEDRYRNGQQFNVTRWANMKPIVSDPTAERKAELKKQIAELQEEFNRLVNEV